MERRVTIEISNSRAANDYQETMTVVQQSSSWIMGELVLRDSPSVRHTLAMRSLNYIPK